MGGLPLTWIEFRDLCRRFVVPALGLLLLVAAATRLQEPPFFRRLAIPFYWPSVAAWLHGAVGLLPLVWCLGRETEGGRWLERTAVGRPLRVVASWLAMVGAGLLLVIGTILISITIDRIHPDAPLDTAGIGQLASTTLVLVPFAAIAPAVRSATRGTTSLVTTWLLVVAVCLGFVGKGLPIPADRLLRSALDGGVPSVGSILASALATVGGLSWSAALPDRRL